MRKRLPISAATIPTRTAGQFTVADRDARLVSRQSSQVLERPSPERRTSLVLARAKPWLEEITSEPSALLSRMRKAGVLYKTARGRYVVAPSGSFTIRQAASPQLLAHLALAAEPRYYLTYLSGLIEH